MVNIQRPRQLLLIETIHTLLNRKADVELSKASFGLQKAWLPEFKAGFAYMDVGKERERKL